ncbi:MAG TPA: Wzz/FepE/Etk N-terminal domain-containing protein [Clostridiales bacterium]|nr:Wzz/FepE/Etk N-terminal domain-containing protein [Clostridiales bacterium]
MELKEYLNIIIKRIWLIILLPLIASMVSAYVSFYIIDQVYEANTTLYIINKSNASELSIAYNDLLVGQKLVEDYKEIVKSRRITSEVVEELDLKNITSSMLAEKINVSAKNETRLIEIRVQNKVPQLAADIANKVADVFTREIVKIMRVENISIVDTAQLPEHPIKPRPMMNIAVAFMVGLLTALGIVFIIEYLDDTIKTTDDVERYLGVTVLGTIPEFTIK